MSIIINKNVQIKKIEGKYKLVIKNNRIDIASLLNKLMNTNNLHNLFPNAIANSIHNMLVKDGYIDESEKVTEVGKAFIHSPYKDEFESGIYAIDFAYLELNGETYVFPASITRKLKNAESNDCEAPNDIICNNDFIMDGENIFNISRIDIVDNCKYFDSEHLSKNIRFDFQNKKYILDNKELTLGYVLSEELNNYAKTVIGTTNYMRLDDEDGSIHIKNISELSNEELLSGYIYHIDLDDVSIIDASIKIDSVDMAYKYSYFYIYNLINNGQYMNINEMNEIYQNEVISKGIFDNSIMSEMQSFKYTLDGFKVYLHDAQYQDLSYKLKVMNELLDYQIIDNSTSNIHDYYGMINYLSKNCSINFNNVERLYMVMGYSFAKNSQNNFMDCIDAFNTLGIDVSVVRKKGKNPQQKEDENIENYVRESGVNILLNEEIGKNFHDRYLVFKMMDNSYKVLLCTCEIGSFFDTMTNETKGSLITINNSEVIKNNKSLINMIEEAKEC